MTHQGDHVWFILMSRGKLLIRVRHLKCLLRREDHRGLRELGITCDPAALF